MRRIIAAALLALPTAAPAEDWQPLSGDGITRALAARVLQYDGGQVQNFFSDGRTLHEAGARSSWGRWWVEGDRYCSTWPPNDTPDCCLVAARGLEIRFTAASGEVAIGRYVDLN